MNSDDTEDNTNYRVVVNHEGQYSIWPAERDNPHGWRDAGRAGQRRSAWITSTKCGLT